MLLLVVKYGCFFRISSSPGIIFGKSALGEEIAVFLILFSPSYFSFNIIVMINLIMYINCDYF